MEDHSFHLSRLPRSDSSSSSGDESSYQYDDGASSFAPSRLSSIQQPYDERANYGERFREESISRNGGYDGYDEQSLNYTIPSVVGSDEELNNAQLNNSSFSTLDNRIDPDDRSVDTGMYGVYTPESDKYFTDNDGEYLLEGNTDPLRLEQEQHLDGQGKFHYLFPNWVLDAKPVIKFSLVVSAGLLVASMALIVISLLDTNIFNSNKTSPQDARNNDDQYQWNLDQNSLLFPTESPTVSITSTPSSIPSPTPSDPPSLIPTVSPQPTSSPSLLPSAPTGSPTSSPTKSPIISPSGMPTVVRSSNPTIHPNSNPSTLPTVLPSSIPSRVPSSTPSITPTGIPTIMRSDNPSKAPSDIPSHSPSSTPSTTPTTKPSLSPSLIPSLSSAPSPTLSPTPRESTTFYVLSRNRKVDETALASLPSTDQEFVVHLGDWNNNNATCNVQRFKTVSQRYQASNSPVFFLPGDNEWNECEKNHDELWREYFMGYTNKYWTVPFHINYQTNRGENFSFLRGYTLHVGLNMVSGTVWNQTTWDQRLDDNLKWVEQNVDTYRNETNLLVIYGHAAYTVNNAPFFDNLTKCIKKWNTDENIATYGDKLTVLYIKQGPKNNFRKTYKKLDEFVMLTVEGDKWPPMKVTLDTDEKSITYDKNVYEY